MGSRVQGEIHFSNFEGAVRRLNGQLYELAALAGRYVFAALMLLIVLRAGRITLIDARRAAALRRMSPETGVVGEFMVTRGGQRAKTGMKYPVIREGMIGSSRRADIRLRHGSVRRKHAWFQMTEQGLRIRANARAPLRRGDGRVVRGIVLRDGDVITVGDVELLLVLNAAPEPARPRRPEPHRPAPAQEAEDDLFETKPETEDEDGIHFFDVDGE